MVRFQLGLSFRFWDFKGWKSCLVQIGIVLVFSVSIRFQDYGLGGRCVVFVEFCIQYLGLGKIGTRKEFRIWEGVLRREQREGSLGVFFLVFCQECFWGYFASIGRQLRISLFFYFNRVGVGFQGCVEEERDEVRLAKRLDRLVYFIANVLVLG